MYERVQDRGAHAVGDAAAEQHVLHQVLGAAAAQHHHHARVQVLRRLAYGSAHININRLCRVTTQISSHPRPRERAEYLVLAANGSDTQLHKGAKL